MNVYYLFNRLSFILYNNVFCCSNFYTTNYFIVFKTRMMNGYRKKYIFNTMNRWL